MPVGHGRRRHADERRALQPLRAVELASLRLRRVAFLASGDFLDKVLAALDAEEAALAAQEDAPSRSRERA